MDGENIEKLEELFLVAVEELRRLKSENNSLKDDLSQHKSGVDKTLKDGGKAKKQLDRIAKLEKENKRLASKQAEVRKKVGNILDELEQAEFI